MFTQKLSMDCTREQYEKYLKDDLLKMGYVEKYIGEGTFDIIVNNYAAKIGWIANIEKCCYDNNDRTYLGSFNAPLFLALAAMTDNPEGGYGEWWIDHNVHPSPSWWMQRDFRPGGFNCKATVSEIMQKFGENNEIKVQIGLMCDFLNYISPAITTINNLTKDTKMAKEKDLRELLQSGRIVEFRDGKIGIIIATHMGLLVQLEDLWHDFTNYDENFKSTITKNNDIIRIREIKNEPQVVRKNFKDAPIIWERKDVKEYTLDEVLKMAGLNKAEVKVIQK